MGRKKKEGSEGLLTPLELEIMLLLWKLGEGSVNDVLEALPKGKDYAYNTVSTVLRILQTKGVVEALKSGRVHTYSPLLTKEEYEAKTVSHVIDSVFEGEPSTLVKRLLDTDALSSQDLAEIRRLLERKGKA